MSKLLSLINKNIHDKGTKRTRIIKRYLQGSDMFSIASELGDVSIQDIAKVIKEYTEKVVGLTVKNRNTEIALQLERLKLIECEAWAAWESSKTESKEVEKTSVDMVDVSIKSKVKKRDGSYQFLKAIQDAIVERSKLLNLYSVDENDDDKGTIEDYLAEIEDMDFSDISELDDIRSFEKLIVNLG